MKKTNLKLCKIVLLFLASIGIVLSGCSSKDEVVIPLEEVVVPPEGVDNGLEVTEGVNEDNIHLDEGSIGLVLDTREIMRKGYLATTAEISLQDFGAFNAMLTIDEATNIAIFKILNEILSDEEKTAFAIGVASTIIIKDESGNILTTYYDDNLILDDSNALISLETDKEYITKPLNLKSDSPYLMQLENEAGVVQFNGGSSFFNKDYIIDDIAQHFYFIPTGEENVFNIKLIYIEDDPNLLDICMDYYANYVDGLGPDVAYMDTAQCGEVPGGQLSEFVLEQEEDGWVRIRLNNTDSYLSYIEAANGNLWIESSATRSPDRFRFISDNITWNVEDIGTKYLQPIIGPVKLSFAFGETLKNCSPAQLTTEVGKVESRTRTTSFSATESLQLFASASLTVGLKLGLEVGASVGNPAVGSGEVKASAEASVEATITTSATTSSSNTIGGSTTTTSEVSRVRTLGVPPFTAVEVYDAVKTVDNVITPFVQTLKISGIYKNGNNAPLTGPEIVSQMKFNFFGGIISKVNDDNIQITIRGNAEMDQIFEGSTEVNELIGACGD